MAIGSSDTVGNGDGASCGGGTAIGSFGSRVGARCMPETHRRDARCGRIDLSGQRVI
jgi:hypothetical protein